MPRKLLHVIVDPQDRTAWYPNFLSGFRAALAAAGVPFEYREDLPADPQGPVFLTRYTLYDLLREHPAYPVPVAVHEHDVWNPFTNVFDPASTWIYSHLSLRAVLLTNPSMCPWVERLLPAGSKARAVAAGFPYDHTLIDRFTSQALPPDRRERLVVFPGRMNEFYQPYLSARLAFEFMARDYRAWIASPIDPQSHYPVSLWREMGIEVGRLPHEEYYALLARAEAAVSCTIGGSLTLALYEAHLLGCRPVAPGGRPDLPPFTEVYHPTYDILNPRQAIEMVEERTPVSIDLTWFSAAAYVQRLLESVT